MTTTRTKVLALLLMLALGAFAAYAILTATKAKADVNDDAFVSVLHSQGIRSTHGDDSLIAAGHYVCMLRAKGLSDNTIIAGIEQGTNLDPYNAGYLVGAAEAAYCPVYLDNGEAGLHGPTSLA